MPTKANLADIFTKLFTHGEMARLSRLIGMRSPALSGKFADETGDMEGIPPEERALCAKEAADAKRQYIMEARGTPGPDLTEMD